MNSKSMAAQKRSRGISFKLEDLHYRHFYRIRGLNFELLAKLYPDSFGIHVGYSKKKK